MGACGLCNRACDREGRCPVCYNGGPKRGDFVEWYHREVQANGAVRMTPKTGKVSVRTDDDLIVRSGKSGSGKVISLHISELARIVR